MRQRLPIDTTGFVGISWPGAIPAEMDAPGPTIVSAPIWIRCSLKMAPWGKSRHAPRPIRPKRRPQGSSGPIAPSSAAPSQAACTSRDSGRRSGPGRERAQLTPEW